MPGATQQLVRRTMLDAGGYWRPLAAVARLLEELGELAELLGADRPGEEALRGELADLWIITAALADQFLARVEEPATGAPGEASIHALVSSAGEIARVVNYYDGPKTPRSPHSLPSLAEAIPRFHAGLGRLAGALGIDLGRAVGEKLEVIRGRDMERFAREDSDPSTAACLARLGESVPEGRRRLWGAPPLTADPFDGAAAIGPSLASFLRAAAAERLEGYAIAIPAGAPTGWAEQLLAQLDIETLGLSAETFEGPAETFLLLGGRGGSRPVDDLG